jgi:7-carboxy-7-deazaguanine synthase
MRLLELYTTVQGEGPNVGKPTTFVRFAGCNMRCPGWPCDTPYAIFPEIWRKEAENVPPKELFLRVKEQTPMHICITGGEPLIQNRRELTEFLWFLHSNRYTVDIFTNGSRPLHGSGPDPDNEKVNYLMDNITFIMDWKLPGSGEHQNYLAERHYNLGQLRPKDAVKLVIKDNKDLKYAEEYIERWHHSWKPEERIDAQVYVGVAWGEMSEADLVHWLNEKGYTWVKLNVQVHKFIFDPNERRI